MLSRCSLDSRTCIQRVFSSRLSSDVGYYFRHPTGAFSKPETLGQKRLGAAIEREITNLLNLDAIFKEGLVERHGCSVHKVWLSKDRSQVSILWDCFPSQASQCSADLKRLQGRLRSCLADRLDMKKVPSLVFIRDKLLPAQARAAAVLDRVARESGGKDPPMTKASGLPEDAGLRADGGGNQGGDRRGAGASDWRHVALGSASKGQDDRRPLSSAASVQQARVDAAVDAIRSRMRAQPNKRSDISAPVAD